MLDPAEPEIRDIFATSTAQVPLLLTDHQGLDVLSTDECRELLRGEQVGRIGFEDNGYVVILPVNYAFVADSVLFRTSVGSKLDIAERRQAASFEVDDWDADERTGWSVLIKGRADAITDEWMVAICEHFNVDPWADQIPRDRWVRISVEEITGRWIFRKHPSDSELARPAS